METTKTLAIIYETGKENAYKDALGKLLFGDYCFTFICINPKIESTYSLSGGVFSESVQKKLDVAEELYIVNPKGTIAHYLYHFLAYAEEAGKQVQYMFKFCYKDCKYMEKGKCGHTTEFFFYPDFNKLLPACPNYSRIYDELFPTSKEIAAAKAKDEDQQQEAVEAEPTENPALEAEPAAEEKEEATAEA